MRIAIAVVLVTVWLIGIPMCYGHEKTRTTHPDPFMYLLWWFWLAVYLIAKGIGFAKDALRWSWLALEEMGTNIGRR